MYHVRKFVSVRINTDQPNVAYLPPYVTNIVDEVLKSLLAAYYNPLGKS